MTPGVHGRSFPSQRELGRRGPRAAHTKEEKPASGVQAPGPAGANTALCVVTTACRCAPSAPAAASYLCGARRFQEL